MSEVKPQENNAPITNKKYVTILVVILVVIALGYSFLTSKNKESQSEESSTMETTVEDEKDTSAEGESDSMDRPSGFNPVVNSEEMGEADVEEGEVVLADLYIKSFSFEDDPVENEEATVNIEIGNKGDVIARDFKWEWWPTDDDRECEEDIDELEPDETEEVQCSFTYTDTDTYNSRAVVDSGDDVEESDEDNNESVIEITPEDEKKADLVISEYSFDPVPEKAVPFTVRIGIKNEGNLAAGEFWWEWWPTAYNYACREKVSELAPNSEKVVTCDYTYGGWSTYPTKAVADADDDVNESNEGNNEYVETVVPIH